MNLKLKQGRDPKSFFFWVLLYFPGLVTGLVSLLRNYVHDVRIITYHMWDIPIGLLAVGWCMSFLSSNKDNTTLWDTARNTLLLL